MNASDPVLQLSNLNVALRKGNDTLPLVKDLSLTLNAGEITGLAGESGCGKTLTALALIGLLDPRQLQVTADQWTLKGHDMSGLSEREWRDQRGRNIAMIFQDPAAALDPVMSVGKQMSRVLNRLTGKAAMVHPGDALAEVGFADPGQILACYPYELSGGMRQLVMIAMAKVTRPTVLLADEPTTALDAATQNAVLLQLEHLAREAGTAVLLITHELRLLTRYAAKVMVMYHGRVLEQCNRGHQLAAARHPYTAGLIAATPHIGRAAGTFALPIPGQVPHPADDLPGCAFAARCERADKLCEQQRPALQTHDFGCTACHHPRVPGP